MMGISSPVGPAHVRRQPAFRRLGVVAPRGTPPAVIDRLNREFVRAMSTPAIRDQYEGLGRIVSTGTSKQMTGTMVGEIPRWRELIRKAGIKPD
jgi:tripartite-type tricarboxylate transporter receptor subunit TctC